jgi:hypothetical protein
MEKETSAAKEFERIDKLLDSSLAATFPASDPVSLTQPGGRPAITQLGRAARRNELGGNYVLPIHD